MRHLFTRLGITIYKLMKRNLETPVTRKSKIKIVNGMSSQQSSTSAVDHFSISVGDDDVHTLQPPIKSENDNKEYRVIRLKNGLTALLISDLTTGPLLPEDEEEQDDDLMSAGSEDETSVEGTDAESETSDIDDEEEVNKILPTSKNETQCAASLTIGVGSFEDPTDIPGLAHFLEHMVFMGSQKYPQENDFDAFIKKQGGHDNASTDWDVTTFYFLCQPRHLKKALDKFAQFFISPLMKKDALQREREAIESEFKLALPSDYHRKKQLLGSFARDGHPARKFPWGNVATLKGNSGEQQETVDSEMHRRLHEFRRQHYVAPSIRLAVQSRHSLDTLQRWVFECFASVPAGPNQYPSTIQVKDEKPFDTPQFKRLYNISPVKDICQVDLTWALPSLLDKYLSKPDKYISWLLGHEGKGSLISYLRDRVWALQLYSGSDDTGSDHNSHYMQFGVTIVLTDDGLKNIKEVLECVFSYLNMLRREGPQERIFSEIQGILDIRFRFAPQLNAGDNVELLSENMHYFPSQHYICGPELFFEYNAAEISRCLDLLTPESVNICLLNKDGKETYDKHEKWFNTPYLVKDIPAEWLDSWKKAEPRPEFTLPSRNEYLTTDFSLLDSCDNSYDPEVPPERVQCDERRELWFKQDFKFKLPKAHFCFQMISPLPSLSSTNSVLLDLFIALLNQQLVTEVYSAELAQLCFTIYTSIEGTGHGLGLELKGFNQKLHLLLEAILKQMIRFEQDLNTQMFLAIKDKQKKQYFNIFLKPKKLLNDVHQSLLKTHSWNALDRYTAIDDVTIDQLANFARDFRSRLYVRGLIQGNMKKEEAIAIINTIQEILNYKPLLLNTWPQLRLGQVELGSRVCRVSSFNLESCNSVVSHIFDAGLTTIRECCIAELIMLLLEEASFDTLRTKEQLGYDVSCQDAISRGILYFSVTVHSQEDKHSVDHVDQRIWAFLKGFEEKLSILSDAELEELRQSAIRHKLRADLQLQDEVSRNWEEVITEEHLFHRRHLESTKLSKITRDEIIEWFRSKVLNPATARQLSLQVQGYCQMEESGSQPSSELPECKSTSTGNTRCVPGHLKVLVPTESTVKPILNIEEYRKTLFYYPIHKVVC